MQKPESGLHYLRIAYILGLLLLGLNLSAQSFKIASFELYNTSYSDSLTVLNDLSRTDLKAGIKEQIQDQVNGPQEGKFILLKLRNPTEQDHAIYLRFCALAQTVQVFRIRGDSLTTTLLNTEHSKSKPLPSRHHYYRQHVSAEDEVNLVLFLRFAENNLDPHYTELYLSDADLIDKDYYRKVALQNLYAGLIILISLLALVSAVILRYRPLLFFGLHLIFWIPYFQMQQNLNGFWEWLLPGLNFIQSSSLNICFLLLFAGLFTSDFIRLKSRLPKAHIIFWISHLLCLGALLYSTFFQVLFWINYLLAITVLEHLILCIYLSQKGHRSAQQLLASIGILIFGALLSSFTEMGFIPAWTITPYFFQAGSLLFSLLLFFNLATHVNTMQQEQRNAEQLVELKSRFFQDISHELRSPLSLLLDPLRRVHARLPEGKDKEALALAKNAGEGLQNLVNQILDLSRHEFSPPPLKLEEQDLNAFLRYQCSQFSSLAQSRKITLSYSGPAQTVNWCFDEAKIQLVISNLLNNALKFCSAGNRVELKLELHETKVLISVSDDGPGISAQAVKHVFERFYQDPESPENAQPGTGIGLALSKALVEQHEGILTVESTKGAGAEFKIELPQRHNPETKQTFSSENELFKADSSSENHTILIAEDHPDLRQYLNNCLSPIYEVVSVGNGEEAWQMALERMPDLIVTDLMMPDLNGIELTQRLKAHPATGHIPVLLLTAKSDQRAVNEGLAAGADDYMAKPFNSDELLLRLANIVKQREIWRKKMAQLDLPKVAEQTLNKVDRSFLEQVAQVLEREYTNPNFNVEDLAEAVALSKTHLNRKLNALMGQSAVKMIQNHRLVEARKMLLQKEGNVSEIAFACGFNSAAYFVKCFKAKYNETPGQLL